MGEAITIGNMNLPGTQFGIKGIGRVIANKRRFGPFPAETRTPRLRTGRRSLSNACAVRCRTITAAGRLTELDRGPLALYCNAYAAWLEAVTALQAYGTMMKSPNGYPIQSPYVSVASKNAEIMIRVGAEFGFTPASRMRLPGPINPLLLEFRDIKELAAELKPFEP